ncbi:dTDP-4-dehydrorhamnose reductase [Sphingobacteriales bacterium UPWRP_1]|nr:dTDP-4-dehydrorhamnose reductase [Sphingobacteriales bacterium TSM_CSM]PSJ78835.1 dTDP-4-dehydrorhamnose reductase [Sphingobacteriales bacterium UPWRP_1]
MQQIATNKPVVLVTGAGGQLGQCLQALITQTPGLPYQFIFMGSSQFNLTCPEQAETIMRQLMPYAVINCAAYTQVDNAEKEPEAAYFTNATGVAYLARECAHCNALLLHISTDFVFDGCANIPYSESHPANPKGIYARSKLDGEHLALRFNPHTLIIRTSWLYSPYGKNFVKTMLRLGLERTELRVVYDQTGSPTYAPDLAIALVHILGFREQIRHGNIYHYANTGIASWYDLAVETLSISGIACTVVPIQTQEYPTPAQRPHYSVLNTKKIRSDFNLFIPYWRHSLQNCLAHLQNNGETS